MIARWYTAIIAIAFMVFSGAALAAATTTGASTKSNPYVIPSATLPAGKVRTVAILSAGEHAGNGYRMVGVPDGLGAWSSDDDSFTLLMGHELRHNRGIKRAHGAAGAFVSRWTIRKSDLAVVAGEDLVRSPAAVHTWNRETAKYVTDADTWSRFCSADLAPVSAFFHDGDGTRDRLFLTGEEYDERYPVNVGKPDHGRAFAFVASGAHAGEAWQLPRLGRMAFENVVASPHAQKKTVVMLMDDADSEVDPDKTVSPSELYLYIGTKTRQGHPIERAGLTNGELYGLRIRRGEDLLAQEDDLFGLGNKKTGFLASARFEPHRIGSAAGLSGIELQFETIAADVMRMQRIEDGAWDPRADRRNDFYFVTTASITRNSRLWRLRFDDVERPDAGGTIEMLLQGDEGHRMLDNIAIDRHGRILMQEDPSSSERLGKIWLYGIDRRQLIEIAAHSPEFFERGSPSFLTQDEESSGIIDAEQVLGEGWFLFTSQAHYRFGDPEIVSGGQLLALYVAPEIGTNRLGPK